MRKTSTWRRGMAAGLAVLALAGCGSMTSEDFKTILSGVTDVARATGEFEASRRAARAGNATPQAQQTSVQAVQSQPASTSYSALSCARPTVRNGTACMENACGRTVALHARGSGGATGVFAMGPGQCAPVAAGTVAFACSPGDRFDWQRATCVSS